jgi:hypothetical protein
MPSQLKPGLARILAARQRMIELRSLRSEALQRYRSYARTGLADFIMNVDPISGSRLVEVAAEGSKANCDLSVAVAFFEGSHLRLSIDARGTLTIAATPPGVLPHIGRVLDLIVPMDNSRAELVYEPAEGPPGARRVLDLSEVLCRLVDHAAKAVESELGEIATTPVAAAPPPRTAMPVPKPALSFSVS